MMRSKTRLVLFLAIVLTASAGLTADEAPRKAPPPRLIGHRGLIQHAPENTLAAFSACFDLKVGFELDVRRSKDGQLVVLHDDSVNRTTNGMGKVADLTRAELRQLDAGVRFDPAFADLRIPTLAEVFALWRERKADVLVAIDLKIDDGQVEGEVVKLAVEHGVLGRLVCIGTAIDNAAVRRRLRAADAKTPVAVLAKEADDIARALDDKDADWIYVRFAPSTEQMRQIHQAGKKLLLSGPKFIAGGPEQWRTARAIQADALLTDFPLECRLFWRKGDAEK